MVLDATGDLFVIDNGALKEIRPVGGYYISPSLPAGLSFDNTTGIISGTPTVTSAATDYKVTASNSSGSASATINITVSSSVSTDDKLSNLAISYGAFSPSFSPSTFSYAEEVPNSVTSVTLTITADFANETIKTYGGTVPSGGTSIPVPLAPGVNTVFIQVFAQDGVSKNIYSVAITRDTASTDASLSNIQMSAGTLVPVFSPATSNYRFAVGNSFASVTLMPTTTDPGATVKVNGTSVTSGTASSPIPLKVGRDTITTIVTAQDGTTTKTYTVVVIRKANVNLISLKLNHSGLMPPFSAGTTTYSTTVGLVTESITVTPTAADTSDMIMVNGTQVISGSASSPIPLIVGANDINILVKALDGTTKTYSVTVNRLPNLNVINIILSHGKLTPAFSKTITSYTSIVGSATTSTTETPIIADSTNTVTVNGVVVTPRMASGPVSLNYGSNIITTVVTGADGTTKTYTVNVIRPTTANLKSLALSSGTLSPVFSAGTTGYTAAVDNTVSTITVTPVTTDPLATVTVNGTPVASGSASGNVTLSVGENAINVAVTGKDGILTKIYTVDVTRASGSLNAVYQPISVSNPTGHPQMMGEEIAVHQGLSPNGDGINDFLLIDGITKYPDNKLQIMNKSGQLVYEAKGYDNSTKVFDGHSNKNGTMQLPGTYFYSLDVTANGVTQHKTGFIVLRY